ncbi:class I SAM-dependent methyltransferase [Desertibacillus haloalkaliphilus]|uniref:class I SAM-dependent methyltransferase n=1 Tax=Desertibacillus haloalkaliphilus TaxID=1328930 RepID=UPI001C263801|nr:class I SAM-dependent methyltransferase [Desertibacillus haloalkaliphilus]MBU8905345.1 methyltransferase domain-containing protein [Desertibacillus haloalkaliphilus]
MSTWYEEHFQTDYIKIYQHRNGKEGNELKNLLPLLSSKGNKSVLDLCCGYGRHSRYLAEQGWRVTGVDLSAPLLQEAIRLSLNMPIQYMRCDMRNTPFNEEMDLVVNMFTSFGYFEKDEENEKVIQGINRALKSRGHFIIDYLNPTFLKNNLIPFSKEEVGSMELIQYRKIQEGYVNKSIILKSKKEEKKYEEKIKLYDLDKMVSMLTSYGFVIKNKIGDYDASPFDSQRSPRMILICQKSI